MAKNSITMKVNFDAIESQLGNVMGWIEEVESGKQFVESAIKEAFAEADDDFNKLTASLATTGKFRHMFEWGTLGVNRGRSNVRPQPTQERARLWKNVLLGDGKNMVVSFVYKPSIGTVPKPTKRDTGMSVDAIKRLKTHKFADKARVMELGITVKVTPKDKVLLLPIIKRGDQNGERVWSRGRLTEAEWNRGYIYRSSTTYPDHANNPLQGTFTPHWVSYWEGVGRAKMQEVFEGIASQDLGAQIATSVTTSRASLRPAKKGSVKAGVNKSKGKAKRQTKSRARGRGATDD